MPQFTTPEGHTFFTEESLIYMLAQFVRRPDDRNWNRLEVAMLAHQQAHYMACPELIQDACTISDVEAYDLPDKLHDY